jgi:hypothetical protein
LKLDATVVLVPADVAAASAAPRDPPTRGRTRLPGASRGRLAEAVRSLNEGSALLAEAQRNGAEPRG